MSIYLSAEAKAAEERCIKWLVESNPTGSAKRSRSAVHQMCLRAADIARSKGYSPKEFMDLIEKLPARRR